MSSPRVGFRPDIQGLRAIAVLLVVLYHSQLFGISGGFIGVDVFFVLSGYLITALLLQEFKESGRIALRRFWARRIRRLLPASWLVIAASVAGSFLFLWPLERASLWEDGVAASLYAINLWLGVTGTDYLDGGDPSLFQHYWSLAVEEQFYVVWPVLVAILVVGRYRSRVIIPALFLVSFLFSVAYTSIEQPIAFFIPVSRAWEFMAGALLAWVWGFARMPAHKGTRNAVALISMLALIGSAFVYDGSTVFPGIGALVPVLATCGLLLSRAGQFEPILSMGIFQYFGNISYSLYLWHWPVLFFAWSRFGDSLSVPLSLVLVGVSVLLADLTYRFVEYPLRKPSAVFIGKRPYVFAVAGTVVVAVVASGMMFVPNLKTGSSYSELASSSEYDSKVPSNVDPELANSANSVPVSYADGCHLGIVDVIPQADCVYGQAGSARSVALIGDSHAAHWLPGLIEAGKREGVAIYSFTKSACTAADITLWNGALRREYSECDEWREQVVEAVERLDVDLVIASDHRAHRTVDGRRLEAWPAAIARTRASLGDVPVVALSPSPEFPYNPAFCLSGNLSDSAACGVEREVLLDDLSVEIERKRVEELGLEYVDVNDWLCSARFCPVISGPYLMYRDSHHIAVPYSESLADNWQEIFRSELLVR